MPKKTNTSEQIIGKLRQAEVLINQGATVLEACRKIEVTDQTFYRWRKEYGGMRVDQARRLKGPGSRKHPPEEAGGRAFPG